MSRGGLSRGRELVVRGFGLEPDQVPRPASSPSLFGNHHPLELEIGSGKGTFLVTESKRRPEVNFLGLEYARRYWLYAADRLRRNECANARIVLTDAETFIRDFLEDESLRAVHVYFPDPWPKKRHHKRRLLQPPFAALIGGKLAPGAALRIVTDHEGYFEEIRKVVALSSLTTVSFGATAAASPPEMVGSNFERKYRREGRPLYALAAKKPSTP